VDPQSTDPLLQRLRRVLAPQYVVERELGAGGMGVVFLGTDVALARRVAIKVLRPEFGSRQSDLRFTREARLLARLHHPNIVTIHYAGEVDDIRYFVMDYVEGRTLADRLTAGPLSPEEVVALGGDLLAALGTAHRAGVVHRDVKPANVFLVGDQALLGDFGIASSDTSSDSGATELTATGQLIGTPAYMAPEQLARGEATPQTDLYAVGLVLYQACSGRRWLAGTDPDRADWTGVPAPLSRVLRKALAVAPAARWADAESFRRALERRRSVSWLLVAAVIALGLAVARWPHSCAGTTSGSGPLTDFAVVPFTANGADDPVAERLARYVGNELEWFPAWRLTSVPTAFAWWDDTPPARRALLAPRALRTRLYAAGELVGGSRALDLSLRDSAGALVHRLRIAGDPDDLLSWGSAVADSVVRIAFPAWLDAFRDLAARGSRNVSAYSELFAGQEAFRRDAYAEAQRHFERALELDSNFAQAAWQLAMVRRWRERSFDADWRRLYELHREQLPELQRLIITAQLEPDLPTRFAALEAAVGRYPRNGEAALVWADELFHRGPLVGIPLDSGVAAMALAAGRHPYFTTYVHLALGHIRLGHSTEAREALDILDAVASSSSAEASQRFKLVALLYDERFRPWRGSLKRLLLEWRADSTRVEALSQYLRFALLFDAPEAQWDFGTLLAHRGRSPATRGNGHEAAGLGLMALGRPAAGLVEFDSAAAQFRTPEADLERAEWRLLPAALGLPPADSAAVAWARATLAAAGGAQAPRAAWALAVDAAAAGDTAGFRRWSQRLRSAPSGAGAAQLNALLAGLAAAQAGDPAGALERTDSLLRYDAGWLVQAPFARALFYLKRGEWLLATAAPERADRTWLWYQQSDVEGWPQRSAQAGEIDAVAAVYARLRRAELAEQRGDQAAACALAVRVGELWDSAEPAYAPLVKRAEAVAAHCPR
jgi:tRNA A-37 threonylcarbamoyl transferase component Bud32